MSNKYDYWFGLVIGLAVIAGNIGMAHDSIAILLANPALAIGSKILFSVYASVSLAIILYCIAFIIYNFIKRKAEITFRGSCIALSTISFAGGLFEIANELYDVGMGKPIEIYDISHGMLVLLTGAALVYAAFNKEAGSGRKTAMFMSMIFCIIYVATIAIDLSQGIMSTLYVNLPTLIGYLMMTFLAYRRKTYILDY